MLNCGLPAISFFLLINASFAISKSVMTTDGYEKIHDVKIGP